MVSSITEAALIHDDTNSEAGEARVVGTEGSKKSCTTTPSFPRFFCGARWKETVFVTTTVVLQQ